MRLFMAMVILLGASAISQAIGFNQDGFLMVDGKPYFPVGIYTIQSRDGDHDKVLSEASRAGFNTTVYYALTTESLMPLLDAANRHGIKAFVYPTMPFSLRKGDETTESITKDVQAKMNHPALLGWYLVDEPEGIGKATPDKVLELYHLVKKLDPSHPCSLVIMGAKAAGDYAHCADVIWTDPYPIPSRPVTVVADQTDACAKAIEGKPLWVVPQAFDWSVWHTGKIDKVHRPTPEEERCMTYLALVHGAKGIIYWAHTGSKYYIHDYPEHWAAVKKIAGELGYLSPVLLTPDSKRKITVKGGSIDWMVKELGGSMYLFAVNREPKECRAAISIPGMEKSKAEALFEGRSVDFDGSSLKDDFKPLEAHVYKLTAR